MAETWELLTMEDRFTSTFNEYIRLAEQSACATVGLVVAGQQLRDESYALAAAYQVETTNACNSAVQINTVFTAEHTAQQQLQATAEATDRLADSQKAARRTTSSLAGSLSRLAKTLLSTQNLCGLLGLSDQMTQTRARLERMNDGLQPTAALNEMVYQSALRSRSSYTDLAGLVTGLQEKAGGMFGSSAETVAFAEQMSKLLALSGTNAQETQGAMLQLTQALASGTPCGEELNSVLEQTPLIAQTIAKYMGVSTGEVRALASEGKVTAQVVKNAMFAAAEETNRKFEDLPKTWGQVWTELQTVALKELQPLFDLLSQLANSDFVKTGIEGVGLAFRAVGAGAQFVAEHIETLGPILAIATAAWAAYEVAVWAANLSMAVNPTGLVAAGIVALVGTLLWAWETCEGFRSFTADFWAFQTKGIFGFYNGAVVPVNNYLIDLLNQSNQALGGFASFVVGTLAKMAVGGATAINTLLKPLASLLRAYNAIAPALGKNTIDFELHIPTDGIEAARQQLLGSIQAVTDKLQIPGLQRFGTDRVNGAIDRTADKIRHFRLGDFLGDTIHGMFGEGSGLFDALGSGLFDALGSGLFDALGEIESQLGSIDKGGREHWEGGLPGG